MSTTNRIKWLGSILLAGVFIALAFFMGGNWGSDYSASAQTIPIPHINAIFPSSVSARSADILMAINGTNLQSGVLSSRVRYLGNGIDEILIPSLITPAWIYVYIPAANMIKPGAYLVSVVISEANTVPTIPITPWDVESNRVPFLVKFPFFMPIMFK
jgi:hypothetical protein